jgi:hypothetical protein
MCTHCEINVVGSRRRGQAQGTKSKQKKRGRINIQDRETDDDATTHGVMELQSLPSALPADPRH